MRSKFIFLTLLLMASAAGCNKPDTGGDDPGTDPSTPYFKASINDIYLQGPDDTGCSFMVETSLTEGEWTVSSDADWLQIIKNPNEVVMLPSEYDPRREDNGDHSYPAPRTATVTVSAGSLFSKTFSVIQESWTRLSSEYEVSLSPSGESVEVTVSHNCYSWTPYCDASWITLKKNDTSTLTITASPRGDDETGRRSAVVCLKSDRDEQTFWNISVSDSESNLGNEDYNYGDHTDWD